VIIHKKFPDFFTDFDFFSCKYTQLVVTLANFPTIMNWIYQRSVFGTNA
jgi:hypothetical protein